MTYKTKQELLDAQELLSPPGDTLADTIEVKGISQAELAQRMGRPLKTINEIIKGKAAITPETALQLQKVVGISATFWMERERNYRLELAEITAAGQMLDDEDWLKNFPLSAMKKLGWLDFENHTLSKANAVYTFFGVSGRPQYENCYHQLAFCRNYRLGAETGDKNPYAVAAWLRQGERTAESLKVGVYDAARFKKVLEEIKALMAVQPADFFKQLQSLCTTAGVKLVHTPCIPGTHLHGATHWQGDVPLIQLSNMYKRNDIFWFTFFHEAGHILKHGKKEVFVEGLKYNDEQQIKEGEANDFAANYLLTKAQEKTLTENSPLTKASILAFAKAFNTHPAAIIGRFARNNQQLNMLGWQLGFFEKIDLSATV